MKADRRERRTHFRGKPRPGRRVEVSYTVVERGSDTDLAAPTTGLSEPFAPEPRRAYTRNIGVGGAFVVTDLPPEPGTPLVMSIHVPTASAPIEVSGEVRWAAADPPGMGVKFGHLGVEDVLQLNEFFASLTATDEKADAHE